MISVDLNSDLGEGIGNDEAVMAYISSANIACGYHAGNDETMDKTIELALKNKVAIGAHPAYKDKENFGRTNLDLPPEEVKTLVSDQIKILKTKLEKAGGKLQHVKPHGALYNQAAKDIQLARAIAAAIYEVDPRLIFMGLANSVMKQAADEIHLPFASEVFADRAYTNEGQLVPRSKEGAVIHDPEVCKSRVLKMVKEGCVNSIEGLEILLSADSICIHGDNPEAIALAKSIHDYLSANDVLIKSMK